MLLLKASEWGSFLAQVDETLEQSAHAQCVILSLPDTVITVTEEGVVTSANQGLAGLAVEKMIGNSILRNFLRRRT